MRKGCGVFVTISEWRWACSAKSEGTSFLVAVDGFKNTVDGFVEEMTEFLADSDEHAFKRSQGGHFPHAFDNNIHDVFYLINLLPIDFNALFFSTAPVVMSTTARPSLTRFFLSMTI